MPERMAHKSQKLQFEIVAVLGLAGAVYTQSSLLGDRAVSWPLIDLPDFSTPLRSIAGSVEKIAGVPPGEEAAELANGEMAAGGVSQAAAYGSAGYDEAALPRARCGAMLELLLCSSLTILPDYLYRRYRQGKRFGHEITFFSVWFELRFGNRYLSDADGRADHGHFLFSSVHHDGDLVLQDRSDRTRDKRPGVGSSR